MRLSAQSKPTPAGKPLRSASPVREAWGLIQIGEYGDAAALLAEADPLDTAAAVPARLARNLVAMKRHRPQVLRRLVRANLLEALQRYPLQVTPAGVAVPSTVNQDGRILLLAGGPDPVAAARETVDKLATRIEAGDALAIVDLADGHVLTQLAARPPQLLLSMQQAIDIVEPDPHLVTACLMLHDWGGANGPIVHPRFEWFVGPKAVEEFAHRFTFDPMVTPRTMVGREQRRELVAQAQLEAAEQLADQGKDWARRIEEHYKHFECNSLTVGTSYRPKVLLLTSRFTSVLKYSTADCEHAFKKLGWRTRTLIEPTDTHRMTTAALRQAIATFKPDLVFGIDVLRSHLQLKMPERLPFVCWIQDQLAKLTNVEAGQSIGPRDFVLSMVGPMYTQQWGYPQRQMIDVPKLTRSPQRPAKWDSLGHDLTYVSSASQQVADLLEQSAHHPVLAEASRRIVAVYEQGGNLPTMGHIGEVVDQVCADQQRPLAPADRAMTVNHLCLPLNNALYRQQALRWVADIADDLDLDFALYGPGWDQHPEFARFAKGPVEYGADLEKLTRDSKINLQIIPSFCLHQRLLDGLVAGGFFLVREHPTDVLMPRLLQLLDDDSQTVAEALEAAGDRRGELEALLKDARHLTDLGMPIDLVSWLRCGQRGELLNTSGSALPRLDKISFSDSASLRTRIERFIKDPAARRYVAGQQRQSVEHRLSYTAGLRRALARIGRLLSESDQAQSLSGNPMHSAA